VVLVEQHAKIALEVTHSALVLNRGRIAYFGPSSALLADRAGLEAHLGVTDRAAAAGRD
jgi:branched-chain amino acid transport system ATP-binding protein